MLASATTNIAIALVASGAGVGILVVLRSRSKRVGTVASPVVETVVQKSPVAFPEVVVPHVEIPVLVPEVAPEIVAVPSVREKAGRTRSLFASAFQSIRGRGIDSATWDELEETLLLADIGIGLATRLLDPLRAAVKDGSLRSPDEVISALRDGMTAQLATSDRSLHLDAVGSPNVWLFVGVNGVGKTTTIGKIATAQTALGTTVLMAAGDTFRAAAAEQLQVWAERSGAAFVRGAEGGDPASVIFDGIQSAAAKGIQ